jgi:hypothetical protein
VSHLSHMDQDYKPLFGSPVSGWYRWFAWRPVETVDRGWIWLRVVNCRRIQKKFFLNGGADFWFQYAVLLAPVSPVTEKSE